VLWHRAILALAACGASIASPLGAEPNLANEREAIEAFQRFDQRLQDVGWRLIAGNAAFCSKTLPAIGLQLQDLASYGRPDIARAALDLSGDFAVQTAARGSPAASIGSITSNREITMLADTDPNQWVAGEQYAWERLVRAHDFVDQELRNEGSITLGFADGEQIAVEPMPVCASRFELMNDSKRAVADGKRVVIGIEFPGFQYEEPLFAAAIAHELAHNLLQHRSWLDRNKRKRRNIRLTEREADRLMPWLLANAGYDPQAAHDFMTTWGPKHDGGLLRGRTHDGWDERAEFIQAEIAVIRALWVAEGKADWATHFRREIDPDAGSES